MESEIEKKVTSNLDQLFSFPLKAKFQSQVASLGVTRVVKARFFIVHCNYLCKCGKLHFTIGVSDTLDGSGQTSNFTLHARWPWQSSPWSVGLPGFGRCCFKTMQCITL